MNDNQIEAEEANFYIEKYKKLSEARKLKFIKKKQDKGSVLMTPIWLHLEKDRIKVLRKILREASTEQLIAIITLLESND